MANLIYTHRLEFRLRSGIEVSAYMTFNHYETSKNRVTLHEVFNANTMNMINNKKIFGEVRNILLKIFNYHYVKDDSMYDERKKSRGEICYVDIMSILQKDTEEDEDFMCPLKIIKQDFIEQI